ncbi:MAG TPA: YceH family protein, partial [Rhodothermales bacterium]|nr:YceH family protein [Rhodothermales bacterium]
KAMTTPDSYPLSLNALTTACNQKTGRDPVTDLSDAEVVDAVAALLRRSLVGTMSGSSTRVAKYRHNFDRALGLGARELAVLAVLMLRGPQTPGELRTRTERLFSFESVEAVDEALWLLMDRPDPFAYRLPRAPGHSADRYVHGLSGEPDLTAYTPPAGDPDAVVAAARAREDRTDALEARVEALEAEVVALRETVDQLRVLLD